MNSNEVTDRGLYKFYYSSPAKPKVNKVVVIVSSCLGAVLLVVLALIFLYIKSYKKKINDIEK